MQWNRACFCEFAGKSTEKETKSSEFPNGGKAILEQILERNERVGLWKEDQNCENHSLGSK